jgi:hypothetical protein
MRASLYMILYYLYISRVRMRLRAAAVDARCSVCAARFCLPLYAHCFALDLNIVPRQDLGKEQSLRGLGVLSQGLT